MHVVSKEEVKKEKRMEEWKVMFCLCYSNWKIIFT